MNKMQIKIISSDGTELIVVPFSTEHVVWAIRNSGFTGRITERVIAQYIGELIRRTGESWNAQKDEWIRSRVAQLYQPSSNLADIDAMVNAELSTYLGSSPFAGYNDDGTPVADGQGPVAP